MKIVNSNEMKKIDNLTIKKGIDEKILMEQASFSVKEIILELNPKNILVIAGTGNNGGDALAVSRLLKNDGFEVEVFVMGDKEKASEGFKNQLNLCRVYDVEFINSIQNINSYDIIIDGIIGNGLSGKIKGDLLDIIDKINESKSKVISIDIPTGISSDNGSIMGKAIKSDITVTFGYLKIGHLMYPGREYSGEIKLTKISFDKEYEKHLKRKLINKNMVKNILPKRNLNTHKYNYGVVTIISGSIDFPGSSILSALGAQWCGAGIVNLITPSFTPVLNYEPSIIYQSLNKEYFNIKDFEKIKYKLYKSDALLIGPGIGKKSYDFIDKIIHEFPDKKIILDADAIQNIKNIENNKNILITPHSGEFKNIVDINEENIVELIEKYAVIKNINIFYKSSTSIITDGLNTYFNVYGDDSLSKGGSGDLLSGMISSFIAQGASLINASIIASYILYKTAYNLGEKNTKYTVTPLKIAKNIQEEFLKLRGE